MVMLDQEVVPSEHLAGFPLFAAGGGAAGLRSLSRIGPDPPHRTPAGGAARNMWMADGRASVHVRDAGRRRAPCLVVDLCVLQEYFELPWVYVHLHLGADEKTVPSISGLVHGPSADWHVARNRGSVRPFLRGPSAPGRVCAPRGLAGGQTRCGAISMPGDHLPIELPRRGGQPPTVVTATGAFAMPVGPVFSDFAELAHFLLETVGEDVIRTIPRFFYKYRGVEKIAEGRPIDHVLLLAERFSGIAAFSHGLAFCQAVEAVCGIKVPERAQALRTVFAELERLRARRGGHRRHLTRRLSPCHPARQH